VGYVSTGSAQSEARKATTTHCFPSFHLWERPVPTRWLMIGAGPIIVYVVDSTGL
jgi:hypothetical protein